MPKRPIRCMRWLRRLWTVPPASGHGEDTGAKVATEADSTAVAERTEPSGRSPSVPEGTDTPRPPAHTASGMVESDAEVQTCGRNVAPPPLQSKVAVVTVVFM